MNTDMTETVDTRFGAVTRRMGKDDSAVLASLPPSEYPNPEPACATCPAKDWYVTMKTLRCYCKEYRFISWLSNDDPIMMCDPRERLIEEDDAQARNKGGE